MITPDRSRPRNALPARFLYSLGGGIETKCGRGKAGLGALLWGSADRPLQGALSKAEVVAAPLARAAKTSSSQSGRISGTEDRSSSV